MMVYGDAGQLIEWGILREWLAEFLAGTPYSAKIESRVD